MATGSEKSFAAVNIAYCLLKYGGSKRILFLVDHGNPGKQTEDEGANFTPPDDAGTFTSEAGDHVVAFAEAHRLPVFGHRLVWHFVTRKHFFESPDGKPLPREKALANLKLHIDGVVGHYKGQIKAWDVVNEAISDKEGEYLKDTPALRAISADMAQAEKGANPYPNGLPPEAQEKLAKRYGEFVAAIARHPEVTMLGFWGTHDGRSWLNDYPVKGRVNHPLLFDCQYQPKPAFQAVIKALRAGGG